MAFKSSTVWVRYKKGGGGGEGEKLTFPTDFPNAPPGTIELIVSTALISLGRAGVHAATFGGSAPEQLQPVGSDWGWRVKMLTKSYSVITKTFRLTDKASFREKFGTKADPQYIAYPPSGLGLAGIEAIVRSFPFHHTILTWCRCLCSKQIKVSPRVAAF
jgi:hypothetical protein